MVGAVAAGGEPDRDNVRKFGIWRAKRNGTGCAGGWMSVLLRSRLLVPVLVLTFAATTAAGQDAVTRRYQPNPADEDWSFLKTAPDVDPWDPVKYIPLGKDGWFATLNGEIRYRLEG